MLIILKELIMETTRTKTDLNQEINTLEIKTRIVKIMTLNEDLSSYNTAVNLFEMRVLMNSSNISLEGCKKLVFT